MIKYFELLLELLEIEVSSKALYISIAKIIESMGEKSESLNYYSSMQSYHRHAFIFIGYQKLLNGEIIEEEFTQIGDFKSKIHFDLKKQDSISFLKSNPVLDNNILYIFDKVSEGIIEEKENIIYC